MAMKRHAHNLSHTVTGTVDMGLCYPTDVIEVFPGDSFKIEAKNLTRFLPQVAPTMHDVFVGVDTYQVPLRQLFEKIGLNWDEYLTGGQAGTSNIVMPTITIPETGYEPGTLADWLGYPTNWTDPETGTHHVVGAGLVLNAMPVIAYMHIINENYLDQNFIKFLDLTKYQEFLDGEYQFYTPTGDAIDYALQRDSLFPKAWSRDYFGRALPNTQRGPAVTVPLGDTAGLNPDFAPVLTGYSAVYNGAGIYLYQTPYSSYALFDTEQTAQGYVLEYKLPTGMTMVNGGVLHTFNGSNTLKATITNNSVVLTATNGLMPASTLTITSSCTIKGSSGSYVDLGGIQADLANAKGLELIAFRLAARMQRFGEVLQQSGSRAVEFTLAMFGVRIPDARVQRPIFHGSFRLPVIFSEVLQTSQTTDTAPLGQLGGHGITGGKNQPIHIKCIEHGYIISIMHVMPRSQYQNIVPKYLLRSTRWDMPNPIFQHVGEQAIKRVEIYPNTQNPDENFGYVPRYSELGHVPSTLHGHMKDTFLHWTMARAYSSEPVLSAAWRYERPTDRTMAVKDEDQMQISLGFDIRARRVFAKNPQPGIHIV
nr:MAG: major capsid protein [Microviridae sp.]